jgi:hypothetical protein
MLEKVTSPVFREPVVRPSTSRVDVQILFQTVSLLVRVAPGVRAADYEFKVRWVIFNVEQRMRVSDRDYER